MICADCKVAMAAALGGIKQGVARSVVDADVAGAECVFCERILTRAHFSLHRWIFGVCDVCACSIAGTTVEYDGQAARGFQF
jgi:hypothetical protein